MPTPASIGEGRDIAEKILRAVGTTLWIADEAQMDAVTAVSGSGPAYVFYFIEALQNAGATWACRQKPRASWRSKPFSAPPAWPRAARSRSPCCVSASPRKAGTTAAALDAFAAAGLADAIDKGVNAATARGRELCDQLGKA